MRSPSSGDFTDRWPERTSLKDGTTAGQLDSYRMEAPDIPRSSEGAIDMNSGLKMAVVAAAVVAVVVACMAQLPSGSGGTGSQAAVSPSPVVARSPIVSPSPETSSSQHATRLTVGGSALGLNVQLAPGWTSFGYGANRGTSHPPAGVAFVISVVDNTFEDPCSHRQRSPKVGPTVEDLATALGEIPYTTATDPIQTTIAGREATYIELAIPASLPCAPSAFYLWQDSPNEYWWVQGLNETAQVWILEVGGERVTLLAHSYPGSSEEGKAELHEILDSIVFDVSS